MHFLRCVLAEWALVRPRLVRTRFGPWLLMLAAVLVGLAGRGADATTIALQGGALGAVLGAVFAAGSGADRAALAVTLSHPTTPLAVATGRWLAAFLPAAGLSVACALALGAHPGAVLAGVTAAAAVAGCGLPLVLALGNGAGLVLFFAMALVGAVPPERLVGLAEPDVARLAAASALELGPALWRYRDAARGDPGALLHGVAWAALGILLAKRLIAARPR